MKFKNISEQDLHVPGVGTVAAGEIAEMPDDFHNANFEKVEEDKPSGNKKEKVEEKKLKANEDESQ